MCITNDNVYLAAVKAVVAAMTLRPRASAVDSGRERAIAFRVRKASKRPAKSAPRPSATVQAGKVLGARRNSVTADHLAVHRRRVTTLLCLILSSLFHCPIQWHRSLSVCKSILTDDPSALNYNRTK